MKPLYTDSLNSWVDYIPKDVVKDMAIIAPMLKVLGYDPDSHIPFYGEPDEEVTQKYNEWLQTQGDQVQNAPEVYPWFVDVGKLTVSLD